MREIPLTQNQVALIDDEDYELISRYTWYTVKRPHTWYAKTSIRHSSGERYIRPDGYTQYRYIGQLMHDLILGIKNVDHKDRNGLNNQRSNLRPASHSQQAANQGLRVTNTSGYKGVSWDKRRNLWKAEIGVNGRRYFLGSFHDPILAALSYDNAAKDVFGEFAAPNFEFGPDSLIPDERLCRHE